MPRKRRPLNRGDGAFRDATLIIIASEDTFAAKEYFSRFRTRRVQFAVFQTQDCRSSPRDVMKRLDAIREESATVDGDTFWLCIDRDRWDEKSLSDVLRDCMDKKHNIALSNPCFEIWMLLHHEEVGTLSANNCQAVKDRLRERLGEYGTHCCRTMHITKDMVEGAMARARAIDQTAEMLPSVPCTRVYRILDLLIQKEAIIFV